MIETIARRLQIALRHRRHGMEDILRLTLVRTGQTQVSIALLSSRGQVPRQRLAQQGGNW